jgi:hypothetical protein
MLSVIPFKPTKGEAFRCYFSLEGIFDYSSRGHETWRPGTISAASWSISKDGGSAVQLTNSPVAIAGSLGYINLTADEMNADVICIYGSQLVEIQSQDSYGYIAAVIIYTGAAVSGGGATAQQVWEYAARTLTANPGITAADVWAAVTRSLTEPVAVTGDVVIGDVDADDIATKVKQKLIPFLA